MSFNINQADLAPVEDKRVRLYREQVQTLSLFLARGAISQAQFDNSFAELTEKMGMQQEAARLSAGQSKERSL